MYTKWIKGHPYLYSSHRIKGKVVQVYMGRATADWCNLPEAVRNQAAEQAGKQRALRRQEQADQRRQVEQWKMVLEQARAALEAAGYHNPRGRGWRKRRSGRTAP